MEALMLIGMLIVKANGLEVPFWCWVVWGVWAAVHLAAAWFWADEEQEGAKE